MIFDMSFFSFSMVESVCELSLHFSVSTLLKYSNIKLSHWFNIYHCISIYCTIAVVIVWIWAKYIKILLLFISKFYNNFYYYVGWWANSSNTNIVIEPVSVESLLPKLYFHSTKDAAIAVNKGWTQAAHSASWWALQLPRECHSDNLLQYNARVSQGRMHSIASH